MPCDSIQVNRLDMPKLDPKFAGLALTAAGARNVRQQGVNSWAFTLDGQSYRLANGQLTASGVSDAQLATVRNQIARGYSEQIVRVAAAKNNWTIKKVGERRFVAAKR